MVSFNGLIILMDPKCFIQFMGLRELTCFKMKKLQVVVDSLRSFIPFLFYLFLFIVVLHFLLLFHVLLVFRWF